MAGYLRQCAIPLNLNWIPRDLDGREKHGRVIELFECAGYLAEIST
jgi:hypothetical protein